MQKLNYRCCFCNKNIKDVVMDLTLKMNGRDQTIQEFCCHGSCFHQKIHENYFLNPRKNKVTDE